MKTTLLIYQSEKENKGNKRQQMENLMGLSRSQLVRVLSMKLFHQVCGVAHFVYGKPGGFFISTFVP